jgi:hypothetical protein
LPIRHHARSSSSSSSSPPPPTTPLINRVRTLTQKESVSICGSDQLAIQLVFGQFSPVNLSI